MISLFGVSVMSGTTGLANVLCFLTDENGNIQNPYKPDAISYVTKRKNSADRGLTIEISGYISLFMDGKRISAPNPFKAEEHCSICIPEEAELSFRTHDFECMIDDWFIENQSLTTVIKVTFRTAVRAIGPAEITVPVVEPPAHDGCAGTPKHVCLRVTRVYDKCCFFNEFYITHTYCTEPFKAQVYHYNAMSDGIKKTYTNADELTQYGNQGILDPNSVSFYTLSINGMVQPFCNYTLEAGKLTLKTEDVPHTGAPIIISFVTFRDENCSVLPAEVYYFSTISDGVKRTYTDGDGLSMYGNQGIPDPNLASYVNVYVNGVLQPKTNYIVEKGLFMLLTSDIPDKGVIITLEFITVRDSHGQRLPAETYTYNALAHQAKQYTNADELKMYGSGGIPNPHEASFYNLFVNAVIQPYVVYSVQQGLLTINADAPPLEGSPVALQFVTIKCQDF